MFVDRRVSEGMICNVLSMTAANAIESLFIKLFAVIEILFLPYFGGVLSNYRALNVGQHRSHCGAIWRSILERVPS